MTKRIVGILATHNLNNGVFVDYIYTGKTFRRRGVARRLLSSLSCPTWLLVESFTPAFRAYLKIGFEIVANIPEYDSSPSQTCMQRVPGAREDACTITAQTRNEMTASEWMSIIQFMQQEHPNLKEWCIMNMLAGHDDEVKYRCMFEEDL